MRVLGVLGCMLCCAPAFADMPALHSIVDREVVTAESYWFFDFAAGNGYGRTDIFTNTSAGYQIEIASIDVMAIDPTTVGFPDVSLANVADARAAGAAANPDYLDSFGAFYTSDDPNEVTWTSTSIVSGPAFPITIGPGEEFNLSVEVRNDKLGLVSGTTNDFGEVLIGYRLNGIVRPDYVHCLGDYDFNGLIDLADLAGLLSTYAMTSDNPDFPYQVDFDASGVIDLADLAGLLADFGEACPA
ncbi:MAG: hypothetical protein KDA32_07425 [Phycisphaerales bacterium]|nr:hypothetical protein [Phycisphaerales bacterium]